MKTFEDFEKMAMLDLSEKERAHLCERFEEIVTGFSALDEYDTDGVEPIVTVLDMNNIMRDDVAVKMISRNELLTNAPEQQDGYFHAPAI